MARRLTQQDHEWRAMSEKDVQKEVLAELEKYDWLRSHHPDSRFVQGRGLPDVVSALVPWVLFVECKREKKAKWYPDQVRWRNHLAPALPPIKYMIAKPSTLPAVKQWIKWASDSDLRARLARELYSLHALWRPLGLEPVMAEFHREPIWRPPDEC